MFTGRCDCLRWVEPRFCCRTLKFFVELRGAGLAVVTVNRVALIWKLVWIDFLTIRETQVMDIVRVTAAAHGRTSIANVHDAIFFKQRLGAELKAELEWQMRAQTGNAYWHFTPKQLRRYEPRHLDVVTEEAAHKQRMTAEQARAVSYQPVGIAEFEVSVG